MPNTAEYKDEIWKDVPGYEGRYQVSDQGRARSLDRVVTSVLGFKRNQRGKIFKIPEERFYQSVQLVSEKGVIKMATAHRLIATLFIQNPDNKPCVNHKNGKKNDSRVENLEWVTESENHIHAYRTGLTKACKRKDGYDYWWKGLDQNFARKCQCLCTGRIMCFSEAAREINITMGHFSRMMNGIAKSNWTYFIPV